jgi:hypothetical protein
MASPALGSVPSSTRTKAARTFSSAPFDFLARILHHRNPQTGEISDNGPQQVRDYLLLKE